jgi:hypothetical protein
VKAIAGSWWRRIFAIAAGVALTYLMLVNVALNLPLTQTLLNQHKPEKYHVYWERAWSWYPLRVHARGISANGQTRSQQWQAEAPSAAASVALLPLLKRSVRIFNVHAQDVTYYQRPRPRPDKDYTRVREFFPSIRDRVIDETPPAARSQKKGKAWKIIVDDIHARGDHRLWIYQMQGALSGDLYADVSYETRGGPFSLSNGEIDLAIGSLVINRDWELSRQGRLKGSLEFAPFVPRENRGIKSLAFLMVDADVSTDVNSLEFLNFYLGALHGLNIDGAGKLAGHVHCKAGKLYPPTQVTVSARELDLQMQSYRAGGSGDVGIRVDADEPDNLDLSIRFADMELLHEGDATPHLTGSGIALSAGGATDLMNLKGRRGGAGYAVVSLPEVSVPDLRLYQRYLPDQTALTLNGGQGRLSGQAELTRTSLDAELQLLSDKADVSFQDYRFKTDLDAGIKLAVASLERAQIDASGSYLRLNGANLTNQQQTETRSWNAALSIDKGILSSSPGEPRQEKTAVKRQALDSGERVRAFLSTADADFGLTGELSDLSWINLLFRNPYQLGVAGSGELDARVRLNAGRLAAGTRVEVRPRQLAVEVLDYAVKGDGLVSVAVKEGGQRPDMDLHVKVDDALLQRRGDEQSFVHSVSLLLDARARDMTFDGRNRDMDVRLQIPSARVSDMSVYNPYLLTNSPLRLTAGKADLTADIALQPQSAVGFVKLKTNGLRSRLKEQELAGDLIANIKLSDGVPRDMQFDISGSSLRLEGVKVLGEEKNYGKDDWSAEFELKKGKAVWKKPVKLQLEADLTIKDSRPLVAMFSNEKGEHPWLEKMLTIENVSGNATMDLEKEQLLVPHAFAGSDKIDVGVKGNMNSQGAEGVFYARFRKLDALLKIHDGKRNLDILRARKKFDEYSTPSTSSQ